MSPNPLSDRFEHLAQAIAGRVVTLVLDSIDLDALLGRVDVNALVQRIDLDAVVERIDLDAILQQVDVDAIVARVDLDEVVGRLDIDAVLDRIDLDAMVARIDINAIVGRLDVNSLVQRVDVGQIMSEIDIDQIVSQTELGSIIAKSTTGVLTEILDVIRAQGVGLDDFIARWISRMRHRTDTAVALGPPLLVAAHQSDPAVTAAPAVVGAPPPERTVERQGHYAGAVSRALALAADVGASWALFFLGAALVSFTVQLVSKHNTVDHPHPLGTPLLFAVWVFIYFAWQWALNGKTVGMALFGIQVVRVDGGRISSRQAVLRTITFPLAILSLGIGFLGILFQSDRQAWYDRFAGTTVVYAWDARAAHLRWLAHGTDTVLPADREVPTT